MFIRRARARSRPVNMVYGAARAGVRGPPHPVRAWSLKAEGISYLAGAMLPAVIVRASRGGAGLWLHPAHARTISRPQKLLDTECSRSWFWRRTPYRRRWTSLHDSFGALPSATAIRCSVLLDGSLARNGGSRVPPGCRYPLGRTGRWATQRRDSSSEGIVASIRQQRARGAAQHTQRKAALESWGGEIYVRVEGIHDRGRRSIS